MTFIAVRLVHCWIADVLVGRKFVTMSWTRISGLLVHVLADRPAETSARSSFCCSCVLRRRIMEFSVYDVSTPDVDCFVAGLYCCVCSRGVESSLWAVKFNLWSVFTIWVRPAATHVRPTVCRRAVSACAGCGSRHHDISRCKRVSFSAVSGALSAVAAAAAVQSRSRQELAVDNRR